MSGSRSRSPVRRRAPPINHFYQLNRYGGQMALPANVFYEPMLFLSNPSFNVWKDLDQEAARFFTEFIGPFQPPVTRATYAFDLHQLPLDQACCLRDPSSPSLPSLNYRTHLTPHQAHTGVVVERFGRDSDSGATEYFCAKEICCGKIRGR